MDEGLNEEWKRAVLNGDIQAIERLCRIEGSDINGGIQKFFEDPHKHEVILAFAILSRVPLERYIFIESLLGSFQHRTFMELAVDIRCWEVACYLHESGIRHVHAVYFKSHLMYLSNRPERQLMEFISCYPGTWDSLKGDSYYQSLTLILKHRKTRAKKAIATLVCLKGVVHKDVMKMIIDITMQPKNVARQEWGYPSLVSLAKHDLKYLAAIGGTILIFLMLCFF